MAGVTQTIGLTELAPMLAGRLDDLMHRAETLAPAMAEIAGALEDSTRYRFELQEAPDGMPWLPSIRAIETSGQTLSDTGKLRRSIGSRSGSDWAEIGTNEPHAGVHQFGATIEAKSAAFLAFRIAGRFVKVKSVAIPARPFLGVSAEDELSIIDILTAHFGDGGVA